MQPDRTETAPALDGIADGRYSLRLVKIRLALTLIAVAILPLAALAPMIRTVLDDSRVAQQERLATQGEQAAAALRRELDGIRVSLDALVAGDVVVGALSSEPGSKPAKAASARLAAALARPSGAVTTIALVDPAGVVRAQAGDATTPVSLLLPAPNAPPFHAFPATYEAAPRIEISVPIPGVEVGPPAGVVVASVPIDTLLRWSSLGIGLPGEELALIGADGTAFSRISTTIEPGPGDQPILEIVGDPTTRATGSSPVLLPGLEGVKVIASAPMTVAALPLPAVAALVALILLLVGAIWWMGRKIVAPAAALDTQRAHFQALYQSARDAALRDSLTGLGNHRAFQESVTRMVDQTRRYGTPFALVLLDIDEFKRINDTRGHAVGDDLLAEVGELIRSTTRIADAGYRIGGDEFAILLPSTDAKGAEILARRLLSRGLEDRSGARFQGPISFSAGITVCPTFGTTRVELAAQADAALYRGKRAGRTIVTVFDTAMDRGHVDEGMRSELSAAVSAVIESGGLTPVYQPIIHLPTGRILGYEGLVRVDPVSGFPHTGALFDAAEIAGRVLDLDRAALDVVLGGAEGIPEQILLSLNVSPRSFEAPEFNATTFLAILRRHGMAPGRVLLELTERDAIRDPDGLRETIHALQQAGVRVAADDVGAGNAGLRLLSQFRFDVVKIDLSLVQGGANQDQTLTVLTSLVGMARRWGALTIAEGVETAAQLQMIRQLEIDSGQGYLLGRPGAILEADRIDLDALAGAVPVNVGAEAPRRSPIPEPASFAPRPATTPASPPTFAPRPTVEAPPVPTAASVIAGGAPNPFAAR